MVDLRLGDCLRVMGGLADESADAVITDPPYSSGGFTRSERMRTPEEKYVQHGQRLHRPGFTGDNRDTRGWTYWVSLWAAEARRILKLGAYFLMFIDWRMLPAATDAIQAGGIVWRGITVWNKGRGARGPHTGYFRHQCEYIVWGSNGPLPKSSHGGPWDGCFSFPVLQADRYHMTGKPTPLMAELVKCVRPGGMVLDPFMGSGTTGVAAVQAGLHFTGIEIEPSYYNIAQQRIDEAKRAVNAT